MSRPPRLSLAVVLIPIGFVAPCPVAEALAPLSPAEQAAFNSSVHEYIGCEGCHEPDRTDRLPRKAIPNTCGDPCHPDPLNEYTASVHREGEAPGAVCTDCHGVHGITPVRRPDSRAYRSLVCGTCHPGPKAHFDRGPHFAGMEKTGAPACASCHGNHRVQRPTIALVEPACLQCHPRNSAAFGMGQQVKARFSGLRDTLAMAESAIARAGALGINVKRPEQTFRDARAGFTRARLVWHGLQADEIEVEADRAASTAQKAIAQVLERLESRRLRRFGLGIAWVVILANIVLLYRKKRQVDRM